MDSISSNALIWAGIVFCISQSAMFSGLNLALLGISRLRLEVQAHSGDAAAVKVLALRQDVNFLLTTILWGNVGINVLLTLLSNSVMTGLTAFLFSTILITFAGEITPQAYFSRHALRMGSLLAPVLRFYQMLLYPVAKPSAMVLDSWLGKEGISYFREQDLHTLIRKHVESTDSDIGRIEGIGAMNFLRLDDTGVTHMGEKLHNDSIIQLPVSQGKAVFPPFKCDRSDSFLQLVHKAGTKWVVIIDEQNQPQLAMNANAFLRDALLSPEGIDPQRYCHTPIIVKNDDTVLGKVLSKLRVYYYNDEDDVIKHDLILIWTDNKRVVTGTDILGRLLRGIATREGPRASDRI